MSHIKLPHVETLVPLEVSQFIEQQVHHKKKKNFFWRDRLEEVFLLFSEEIWGFLDRMTSESGSYSSVAGGRMPEVRNPDEIGAETDKNEEFVNENDQNENLTVEMMAFMLQVTNFEICPKN